MEWSFDHEVRLKFVCVKGTKWLRFSVKYLFYEAHESRLEIFIAWERLNMIFFSLVSDSWSFSNNFSTILYYWVFLILLYSFFVIRKKGPLSFWLLL